MPAAAVNHTLEAGPVAVPRAVLLPVVHEEPPPGAPGASPAACARVPQPARTRAPVLTTTTMDARQRSMTPIQTPVKPAGKGSYRRAGRQDQPAADVVSGVMVTRYRMTCVGGGGTAVFGL